MRIVFLLFAITFLSNAQSLDSVRVITDSTKSTQRYSFSDQDFLYHKPSLFQFVTQQPKTFAQAERLTWQKKSITSVAIITVATLLLLPADQKITNGVKDFYSHAHLSTDRDYKSVVRFHLGKKEVNAYEAPQNFNTVLYSIGEGSTTVFIAGGLSLYGHLKNDYRARQTSSQLMQTLIAVGFTTQLMKRIAGRESPFVATQSGGKWQPLTNPSYYQKHIPILDAFPSEHMATMVATVTVLASNYPEKRWISPIGYSIIGLVGIAMIGNGVHWMSDYPLAIGTGYIFGKAAVKINRTVQKRIARR